VCARTPALLTPLFLTAVTLIFSAWADRTTLVTVYTKKEKKSRLKFLQHTQYGVPTSSLEKSHCTHPTGARALLWQQLPPFLLLVAVVHRPIIMPSLLLFPPPPHHPPS
jgi:hypothetical protein